MNGDYGQGLLAFQKLFDSWPWFAAAIGFIGLIWIASEWIDA
ncbi:hypothetical protein [Bradyrhizobium sp. 156]|nr:hypothetical protein [Bradyrhizobium sp. 156]